MARKKKKEGEERAIAVFNPISMGNGIVKKAEQLVTSRYSLTTTEVKIISCLISMVRVSDTEFTEYGFKVADWKNERELKRKDIYEAFEKIAIDLMKKPITIKSKNGAWLVVNWVSSAQYVSGTGIVKFQISDKLKPFLLNLKKRFLQYDIKNILPLKSAYSIRIYELLKDWYMAGTRYYRGDKVITKIVALAWLRQTFQVPEKCMYGEIKRSILQKAMIDLPKYTDLIFKYEEIKTVRKVTHIKFFIKKNRKKLEKEEIAQKNIENSGSLIQLLALLPEQYRTAAVEKLLKKYKSKGVEYIKKQIEYTGRAANATNYLAYLHKALQNDFAGVQKSDLTADINAQEKTETAAAEQTKERQEHKQEEEIQRLEDFYANMTKDEREEIQKEALRKLHEKHPNAREKSATFGELSVEITIRKILLERLDAI